MQTAIDTYLVTSLSSNFRSVQRSEMNPPLRVTLLSPVFLRALVCWFWHRHYAKHYIALAHYAIFSIRYGTTVLVISFTWRWVFPSVLKKMSQIQWRSLLSIYRCHSSALPNWVKKEIAVGGILGSGFTLQIELLGYILKCFLDRWLNLSRWNSSLSHLLDSSLWCLCSIPHLPA